MKNILIDTILYNPTTYIYNVNMENMTATLFDTVADKIKQVKIISNKSGTYIRNGEDYHYPELMFDISEKHWNMNQYI